MCHKVAALDRLIDWFGAYISHLVSLTANPNVKSCDRQRLKGYILRWRDSKLIIGCAFFHDLLRPAANLCKALQANEVCVVGAIEALLKTSAANEKVKSTAFQELPTVKKVLSRIKHESGSVSYQGVDLTKHNPSLEFLKSHHHEYVDSVQACLRNRVKAQNTDLLTHVLATNGWERSEGPSFGYEALEYLCTRFCIP